MNREALLDGLNPQQRDALLHTDGALLVIAGAGSGKTRVITHKYAYLVREKRLSPSSILTVTFTNKAAEEMKGRIASLLSRDLKDCWIGTFHSQCMRILRREIQVLGYRPEFVVYDEDDQHSLIRHILKELKIYEALYRGVVSRINSLKASMVTPEEFLASGDGFGFDEKLAKVYVIYQDELRRCNALDFDDLILLTVRLFRDHPDVLRRYRERFSYILVDEFQDINSAQYELVKLLALGHRNISAVGDDDQSIYRFRGAEVANIYRFEEDFPDAKVIKLEQNYRSTQNILDVSGSVISRNPGRKAKQLWTERGRGEHVNFYWLPTEEEEAKYVAKTIKDIYLKGVYNYGDMAVLYRINLQSRAVEVALKREGVPYRVVGGVSFFERKEVKDIVSYLRLSLNQHDNVSLRRVINTPHRGIGSATLNKIEHVSRKNDLSLFEAIRRVCRTKASSQTVLEKLEAFLRLLSELSALKGRPAPEAIEYIVELTGYSEGLEDQRLQSLSELTASAEGMSVEEFLERVSLFTRLDEPVPEDAVSLMTIHAAKGLEFPVTFIIGLEEGVLPYFKSSDNEEEICEERRLFYVGLTRTKDLLYLTGARKRRVLSRRQRQEPSRFLSDIPKRCCQWIEKDPCGTVAGNGVDGKGRSSPRDEALYYAFPYKTGCRVRHPKWGIGVVRDCYGEGDDRKVYVNFPGVGVKRLALKFAQLERV